MVSEKYEIVIGLEVHAQLKTISKVFCGDKNEYGSVPNTNVSAISLGHPGTLPKLNKKILGFATRLGLACKSQITRNLHFDRKNYFYPDLPKGYQITQNTTPICVGGQILIADDNNNEKAVNLTRIHIEEDAGKSIHDQDSSDTLVDLNRAGVPLLEIVSEPEMRSSTEACNYLMEIRKLVRYLDICDGNMEEGSLRCDANVSVRLKGVKELGNRAEVKNLNSFKNLQKAIDFEVTRHIQLLEEGKEVDTDTRSFEAATGTTFSLRSKEAAHDYRYFPEPDLPPFTISKDFIENIKSEMPALPNELKKKYINELKLTEYDALVLTESRDMALYFERIISKTSNYKAAANWLMTSIKGYLNQETISIDKFPVSPEKIASLIELIDAKKISNNLASLMLFPQMLKKPDLDPLAIAEKHGWLEETDQTQLKQIIQETINKFPDKVKAYQAGKKNLLGLFMGEIMRSTNGTADPKIATQLLKEKLEN